MIDLILSNFGLIAIIAAAVIGLMAIAFPMAFRRVVPTNMVHIVQTGTHTHSYGKDTNNGNSYYEIPHWVPRFGVLVTELPVSNFELKVANHKIYDKDRLPILLDATVFFRINDSNIAAQRVSDFRELMQQLQAMVESTITNIMSSFDIEQIVEARSEFGAKFEEVISHYLKEWGVVVVRNLAIESVRDGDQSKVIESITAKRSSGISSESRIAIAKNSQAAEQAEIESRKNIEINRANAEKEIGKMKVNSDKEVQVEAQLAAQTLNDQQRVTKEKELEIIRVNNVKSAEINSQVKIVEANQKKQQLEIEAEANFNVEIKNADAKLAQSQREAQGLEAVGKAKAEAEKAMQMAPVQAQIELGKEIGQNAGYQHYLVVMKQVEALKEVGVANSKALEKATVTIVANSSNGAEGLASIGDLFSAKGGTAIGSMLQGFMNTPAGKAVQTLVTGNEVVETTGKETLQ